MDANELSNATAGFPKKIVLKINEDKENPSVCFTMKEPYRTMQSDSCAFEGWVLILHEMVPRWKIYFDIIPLSHEYTETLRFHRFLYRIYQFNNRNFSWFVLSDKLKEMSESFVADFYAMPKRISYPRSEKPATDKVTGLLQEKFSARDSVLLALPECEGTALHTMMPISVLRAEASEKGRSSNLIFPNDNNNIDIWSIKESVLNIFVLRYQQAQVGIVSELAYYASLCRDVFVEGERCGIAMPPCAKRPHRGFEDFYDEAKPHKIKKINAWFLADAFHDSLNVAYICDMLSTPQISFQCLKYSYDLPLTFETNVGGAANNTTN